MIRVVHGGFDLVEHPAFAFQLLANVSRAQRVEQRHARLRIGNACSRFQPIWNSRTMPGRFFEHLLDRIERVHRTHRRPFDPSEQ